jgi:hypothetical protein
MNWDAVSGTAEIIGALAIVISLIYVAVQVRHSSELIDQNNQLSRANTWHAQCALYNEVFSQLATDPALADIYERALKGDDLDGAEGVRFCAFVNTFLAYLEDTHVQSKSQLLSEELKGGSVLNMAEPYVKKLMRPEPVRKWWREDAASLYTLEFYQSITEQLVSA